MPPRSSDRLRVHLLLAEVLELPEAEREGWLARLRSECPEIVDEVLTLLRAEPELDASGFLSESPLRTLGSGLPVSPVQERQVGAYTLERLLGRGGMGSVWLARRSDGRFEGKVAVKLLNIALADPVGAERFRREGSVLARLDHPNIARLLDAGVTDEGQPYLVLEYVVGTRIDEHADAARLESAARIGLFLQVLGAVGHAHAALVVHRDLKPANILVTAEGRVKLLDFGIAKLIDETGTGERSALTAVGGLALTPEYAAPEQVTGDAITIATDVYALGVLLYLLLGGRHPTGADCRTAAEHLRAITELEPRPLGTVAGRLYRGDLENICAKALQKQPAQRYATAHAFADDLQRYLRHEPVGARADSWRYRVRKFARRHRAGLAVAALALLALGFGAGRERYLRGRAEQSARRAEAVQHYLVGLFQAADPYAPPEEHPADVTARALLDRGAQRLDTTLATEPDVKAVLQETMGQVYGNLGLYDRSAALLRQALDERRRLYPAGDPAIADATDALGLVLFRRGSYAEAERLLREGLRLRQARPGSRDEPTAESAEHLALLLEDRNDFAGAEPLLRQALAIRRALHGDSDLTVAASEHELGEMFEEKGDNRTASGFFREALRLREARLGPDHPLTAQTVGRLASSLGYQGDYAEAERLTRRALAAQRKSLGDEHPAVASTLNNLGQLLVKMGRSEEAERLLREALGLNRRIFGDTNDAVSANLGNLAIIVRDRGELDEAERLLREALAIDHALYGAEHYNIGFDLNELAVVLRLKGRPDSAVVLLRDALSQSKHLFGDDNRGTLAITVQLARALRETGRLPDAERLFREAIARLDSTNADAQLLRLPAQIGLGRTLTASGRAAQADTLLAPLLDDVRRRFGPAHWRTAEAELALGESLLQLRRIGEAEPLLRQAAATLGAQARAQPQLASDAKAALARAAGRLDTARP